MGRGCIDLSVNIWVHLPLHETADEMDRVFSLSTAIIGWACPQSRLLGQSWLPEPMQKLAKSCPLEGAHIYLPQ